MSRVTNAESERYVTCGFFNSDSEGARKYDATDFSKLFDGMVTDGVFASIGDCLVVKASSGTTVSVGTGKCFCRGNGVVGKIQYRQLGKTRNSADTGDGIVAQVQLSQFCHFTQRLQIADGVAAQVQIGQCHSAGQIPNVR